MSSDISIGAELSVPRATLSALSASLIGIGLARFAYTPLIPALIAEHWFTPSATAYLGAANLAGYLAGALLARPLAARHSPVAALRSTMALAALAFFACAVPLSFLWYFAWRFAAGFAGGVLMVLAAPTVLPHVAPKRRGLVGGAIFTGVGLGIALSGTLVPLLLRLGLAATWCDLGALAAALTALAWTGWPHQAALGRRSTVALPRNPLLTALYAEYALAAVGLVPHMVFLVDFVARGLGEGVATGSRYWVVFGLGALAGPTLAGHVADRIGFSRGLRLGFALQAACVALVTVTSGPAALLVSSAVIGGFVPGIVALVLGRAHELVGGDAAAQQRAWRFATIAFAIGQAVAAYGFSYLYAGGSSYALLFALGAGALVLALLIDLAAPAFARRR